MDDGSTRRDLPGRVVSKPKPRICGPFIPGPPGEADHNGLSACQRCQLVGRPGDAHHPMPDPPAVDVQQLRAGENDHRDEGD